MIRALALLACVASTAQADILQVPPEDVAGLNVIIDFDSRDRGPEPGEEYDRLVYGSGVSLGATLAGMSRDVTTLPEYFGGGKHFAFVPPSRPALPLKLGATGSFAIAQHRGFGSNALFPIGPDGVAATSGRGEGTLAILFEHDQNALSLDIHADYPDPLGAQPIPGLVDLKFWGRNGAYLGGWAFMPEHGVISLAFRSTDARVAAVIVSNTDPGGIAIDNIRFQSPAPFS